MMLLVLLFAILDRVVSRETRGSFVAAQPDEAQTLHLQPHTLSQVVELV